MKKVLLPIILIITLLIACIPAYASSNVDIDNLENLSLSTLSDQEVQKLKNQINRLSDSEFDRFIVEYLRTEDNKQVAKEKLEKLGVQLVLPSTKEIEPLKLDAWELDFSVYVTKRGGESFYRIVASYVPNDKETYPASYDALGITWDPSKASYYGYNVSSQTYSSLKDYSQKSKGIVVFNVYDSKLSVGGLYYDAVYVTPKVSGAWMDFGAKYTHTYLTSNTSVILNPSITYKTPGIVAGSLDYKLNISSKESSWQKADTNAVRF
ncbi:MAG: hypothetical protein ACOX2E_03740 [Syntrophaceticus sp.]